MITETLKIANLKCGGCETTVSKAVSSIPGVSTVDVEADQDQINLAYRSNDVRAKVISKLASLGYPEATAENGLLMQLKSYASCMVGRVTK